jgi:hypothetical protein
MDFFRTLHSGWKGRPLRRIKKGGRSPRSSSALPQDLVAERVASFRYGLACVLPRIRYNLLTGGTCRGARAPCGKDPHDQNYSQAPHGFRTFHAGVYIHTCGLVSISSACAF